MTKPETDIIETRHNANVAVIRINREKVRNALNISARRELARIFLELAKDSSVRCIVLTGSVNFFCSGADVEELAKMDSIDFYLEHIERLSGAVAQYPYPVIAAINGAALGGGLELAMNADIIIAGHSAKFGQPEVRVGIMPGSGGTQRLTRAIGKFHAMRLCLTGEIITAEEAYSMGLVSNLVKDEDVMSTAVAMAERIAELPPLAIVQTKEVLLLGQDASLNSAMALERKALQLLFASSDKNEGMLAYLEKRKPRFHGR
jgi:enoyl-CoA hydratase/carnithine racemase